VIVIVSKEEKEILERLRRFEADEASRRSTLLGQVTDLRAEIETLKIEKGRKQEEHAKEERELRHMIGLEKKRQEFEIAQAKKETALTVREENLTADKKRFAEEMTFQRTRFEEEVKYLKDMMKDILDRLPNVNMEITRGGK
jgi:hypothetical protein